MIKNPSIYINILTDFGFRHIFGPDADKDFIISFLNSLIGGPVPITDVTFIEKESEGHSEFDHALIPDIHCELKDGRKLIVEMQNRYQTHYDDRAVYYIATDLNDQAHKGHWDYKLTPVYGVYLMNSDWNDVDEQYLREDICLYNMQTRKVFSNTIRLTFLKIPMFTKKVDECRTVLDKWLFLFKNLEKMESMPQSFIQDPVFRKLAQAAQFSSLNENERETYRKSLKSYRDAYATYETERAEGRALGLAQGMAEGRAVGKAEGKAEERKASFRNMLSFGITPEQIASKYRIQVDEVLRIANSN